MSVFFYIVKFHVYFEYSEEGFRGVTYTVAQRLDARVSKCDFFTLSNHIGSIIFVRIFNHLKCWNDSY